MIRKKCLCINYLFLVSAALCGLTTAGVGANSSVTNPPHAAVHSVATDMTTIMTLLNNHEKIRLTMKNIPGGERTITTSTNPALVKAIRLHEREMQVRVQQGRNIRPNDPLFIQIFRHHREIKDVITDVPGGVSEDETSRNPQVVLLIRAHAQTVAKFVRQGLVAAQHNTPLPKGYHLDTRPAMQVKRATAAPIRSRNGSHH